MVLIYCMYMHIWVGGAVLSSTNCPQEVPAFDSTGDDVKVSESICLELICLFPAHCILLRSVSTVEICRSIHT